MHTAPLTIGVVILGCDKNTVDAEHLAGLLAARLPNHVTVIALDTDNEPPVPLEAVVIYTCAFILDAQEQSVDAIVTWGRRKMELGVPRRLYVAGCLSQRYASELPRELPEVDAFFGVDELEALARAVCEGITEEGHSAASSGMRARQRLDNAPYAYLKIADGCDHACAFCIIPNIKGPYKSVSRDALLHEARVLLQAGVRELNLIAQDCTAYGRDLYDAYGLPDLLRDLCALDGDFWIRCLYCYPGGISDALIEQIATQAKVAPYLDIPLQHLSPRVLRAMGRPAAQQDIPGLAARLRAAIPQLTLRTTMMVGFPGETAADFAYMRDMVRDIGFEWLGVFVFSPEEGTPAFTLQRQVGHKTAQRRRDTLMAAQAEVTERFNKQREGQVTQVLIEEYDALLQRWRARSTAEAPDVDGCIFVEPTHDLHSGQFATVRLMDASLYDMGACVVADTQHT